MSGARSAPPQERLRRLRDLIWPRRCILCRSLTGPAGERLCPACAASLPEPISGARRGSGYKRWAAAFWYEGPIRDSLLRFKFGGCGFYAQIFGPYLARAVQKQLGGEYELLTYIPISRRRQRRRGYDQSLLLARQAGAVLGMTPVRTLVKRNRRPQSRTLEREERQANIRGAFRICAPELVRGKRLLLLDDVLTTGATVSEAARVLLEAGARSVDVAVLAVAPK